jgi:hypothetical protein
MEPTFERIKANLFPASHAAIRDWHKFPWHKYKGQIQADKPGSSQALAIDVFGTIKVSKERDHILGELARRCGAPSDGPRTLELEWIDPDNLLCESKTSPTQVDAIAFGQRALLVIECKFTEPSGACSQPTPIEEGLHKGWRQCSGDY